MQSLNYYHIQEFLFLFKISNSQGVYTNLMQITNIYTDYLNIELKTKAEEVKNDWSKE